MLVKIQQTLFAEIMGIRMKRSKNVLEIIGEKAKRSRSNKNNDKWDQIK